jgi:cellulose synthase/poly-beta-1,6-N-acetylglucosamine synthase-like glycosyltransferase
MYWFLLIFIIPYLFLLLGIYKNLVKIKTFVPGVVPKIFISVVVSCRNEEKNLPPLLNDISEQDYPGDQFEIIIIDDNSSDRTFTIASEYRGIQNLRVLKNNGKGKKQAIRTGVAASSGELIITTDTDCRMGKRWISAITSFYDTEKPEIIICPVKLEGKQGIFQRFQELEFLSLQGVTAGTAVAGNPVMCNGANMAFTKEAYKRNSDNLHDEIPSGDDIFLLHSVKREPVNKIMWLESPEAVVTTGSQGTIGSFIKQRTRWISKAGAYKDLFTRALAIVTFVTILLQWFLLIAGIFNPVLLLVLLAALLLKSVPDFLILRSTTQRYGRKSLMWLFLPSQIIYPVYVISVFLYYSFVGIGQKN